MNAGESPQEEPQKYQDYIRSQEGFWVNEKTGQEIGHDDDCKESYRALSELFKVFSEIEV